MTTQTKVKIKYTNKLIESQVAEDLIKYQKIIKKTVTWPIDLEKFIETLWGIEVVYENKIVNPNNPAEKIVGCLLVNDKKIAISIEENNNPGRLNYTTAHEAGHVSLHSSLSLGLTTNDVKEKIYCRSSKEYQKFSRSWGIEQQANHYATCLLMPENQIKKIINPNDIIDLNEQAETLMQKFGVSRYALELRLHKLGLTTVNNTYNF